LIITVTNQKGGVGKTTTAINLSAALAMRGHKTLLVDMDPQSNSSVSFVDVHPLEKSVFEVLTNSRESFTDIIVPTAFEHLSLAPSKISLAKLESRLVGELDSIFRLKDQLEEISDQYEHIIIDTPPTLGIITVNGLVAATHVLIPIQSSYFALEGTEDLLETLGKIKDRPNPDLEVLGVLITIHDKRTLLARDIKEQVEQVFGDKVFKTCISKSVRLEESPAYKEPIFTFAPRSSGAAEYSKLCEEVIKRGKKKKRPA